MLHNSDLEHIVKSKFEEVNSIKLFYQYAEFDIALDEIILKQSLRFSNPKTFNDPFDCNEKLLKVTIDDKSIKNTINELSTRLSQKEKRELERRLQKPNNFQKSLNEERKGYKLSCFSKTCNEVLMWSHYAKKHSGICVGFDFPAVYDKKFMLCPVEYLEELTEHNGLSKVDHIILYWLTSKSIRWVYEEEIRAICHSRDKNSQHEYVNYDKRYIREVIFGCNVSDSAIKGAMMKMEEILDFKNITFKKMIIDDKSFLLRAINI